MTTYTTIPLRTHNHEAVAGGGQLDHGAALTGLADDDHDGYLAEATQAEAEAETAGVIGIPPDLLRHHPGVAKAWCHITSLGLLSTPSYNVASVTDTAVGDRTVVWDTDFSTAIYAVGFAANMVINADECVQSALDVNAVGSCRLQHYGGTSFNTLTDMETYVIAFGDQA